MTKLPPLFGVIARLSLTNQVPAQEPGLVARECGPVTSPKQLPTVSELIDSAAIAAWSTGGPGGRMVIGLRYGDGGKLVDVVPVEGVARDAEASVVAAVSGAAKKGPKNAVGFRLVIAKGEIAVDRSVFCPPVPMDQPQIKLPFAVGRVVAEGDVPPAAPSIRLTIGINGLVESVQVVGEGAKIESSARRAYRSMRYLPALLDGKPVRARLVDLQAEPLP